MKRTNLMIIAGLASALCCSAYAQPVIYPAGGQSPEQQQQQQQLAQQQQSAAANQQAEMDRYYRAFGACMSGGGYTVN